MSSNNNNVCELFGELKLSEDSTWYAAYTKSRHEKKVAQSCEDYNISYYLPLQESVRYYKNRTVTFMKPMFPSYIFCNCTPEQKLTLCRTGLLCSFIPAPDQELLIKELRQIHDVRNMGVKLVPHKYLTRGRKVKIVSGPFKDYQGKITCIKGSYKLLLNIDLIKQAVAIEVDADDIALMDE